MLRALPSWPYRFRGCSPSLLSRPPPAGISMIFPHPIQEPIPECSRSLGFRS